MQGAKSVAFHDEGERSENCLMISEIYPIVKTVIPKR